MALLIAISGWEQDTWPSRLSALLPDRDIRNHPETTGEPSQISYLFAWKPPGDLLAQLTNLKVIFSLGAGVDHIMSIPGLPDVPIVRIVDPDLTMRMTEWIVLQVLLHHRKHRSYRIQQRQRIWKSHDQPAASAVRVGILGLGVLGSNAARALSGLGFQVAGWSRTPKEIEGVRSFSGAAQLEGFLARTDILVNLLPLTPETTGFLDHALFEKLSRDGARHPNTDGPILINAGRGGSQVESDIVRALDDGTLAACSLDVFEQEPLRKASPLWSHPKAIVAPHIAAESDPDALSRYIADQIVTFEAGGRLTNLVDRNTGY